MSWGESSVGMPGSSWICIDYHGLVTGKRKEHPFSHRFAVGVNPGYVRVVDEVGLLAQSNPVSQRPAPVDLGFVSSAASFAA